MKEPHSPTTASEVTLREDASTTSNTPGSEATSIETPDSFGPAAVALAAGFEIDGWRLREAIKVTSGEADLWVASGKQDGHTAVIKVFRWGLRPKAEIEAKLSQVSRAQVVDVYGRGVLADGRHYEILEHIRHGTLADLCKGAMAPARVKEVLKELADAVDALHEAGILHRDMKPSNVLVRTVEPLDLVLADFGISSLAELSLHATSAHRTAAYSAPEAMTGVVSRASDWWSVGVMVLELLRGAHPFAGLDERAVNFQLVTRGIEVPAELAPDWALLVKGLLTRDHAKRWGAEQVGAWLEGKRSLTVHYTAAAAAVIGQKPYRFQGREYGDASALATALAEQWEEGVKHCGRGYVLQWIEKQLEDQDLANRLHDVQDEKGLPTPELQLGAAVLVMNPDLPLSYKGELVTPDWLRANWQSARQVLDSQLPQWLKRLRGETWLEEAAQRWRKGLEFLQQSKLPLDTEAAERLLAAGDRAVVDDLLAERRSKFTKGRKRVLTDLLKKERLAFEEAVLLAAAAEKEFYTSEQLLVEETTTWMDRQGIKYGKKEAIHLILSSDESVALTQAEQRRRQFSRGRTPAAHALLQKAKPDHKEAVLLATADPEQFLTPQDTLAEDGLAWINQQGVEYDKEMAKDLLRANHWDSLMPLVEQRRAGCSVSTHTLLDQLLRKPELQYFEGVLLVTAPLNLFRSPEEFGLETRRRQKGLITRILLAVGFCVFLGVGFYCWRVEPDWNVPDFIKVPVALLWFFALLGLLTVAVIAALGGGRSFIAWIFAGHRTPRQKIWLWGTAAGAVLVIALTTVILRYRQHQLGNTVLAYDVWFDGKPWSDVFPGEPKPTLQAAGGQGFNSGQQIAEGNVHLKIPIEGAAEERFDPWERTTTIVKGKTNDIGRIDLVGRYGSARITSYPTGAEVYRNEVLLGKTPLVLTNLIVGNQALKLKRGKAVEAVSIAVQPGQTQEVKATLQGVEAWGSNENNECNVPLELGRCQAVAAGLSHTMAYRRGWGKVEHYERDVLDPKKRVLMHDREKGAVVCWGDNKRGQCDVPKYVDNCIAIAAGGSHSVALRENYEVVCWGANDYGQCHVPSQLGECTNVAAGLRHTVALKRDGTVACWGDNQVGQCRIPRNLGSCSAVAAGLYHTVALQEDGTVACWGAGDEPDPPRLTEVVPGSVADSAGLKLGDEITVIQGTPILSRYHFAAELKRRAGQSAELLVKRGTNHLAVLMRLVSLAQIGLQVGTSTVPPPPRQWIGEHFFAQAMVPTNLGPCIAVAAGGWHTVALKKDGSIVCWGANMDGQCDVPPQLGPCLAVAAGDAFTAALKHNGEVVCWGNNKKDQCKVPAGLGPCAAVAAGGDHVVALLKPNP